MNISKPHLLHFSLSSQTDLQMIHEQSIRNINGEQIMDLLMKYFETGKALYYQVSLSKLDFIFQVCMCVSNL